MKYFLRSWTFTGYASGKPSTIFNQIVLRPIFSVTMNGPIHKCWNLVCSFLSLCGLSHFKNKSPTLKLLSIEYFSSNHILTNCWCYYNLVLDFSLYSSNLSYESILYWRGEESYCKKYWANCNDGSKSFECRIASLP